MRWALAGLLLYAVALTAGREPAAEARPEFARRESLACGYCHIQPRGGGPRNSNGLRYARNEFKFPVESGNLNSFADKKQRSALVHARKLIRIDHVQAAHTELTRLARAVKQGAAKQLVDKELHQLAVRGDEILGQARLLLRKKSSKKREAGVEMLCVVAVAYKGLDAQAQAKADLKELRKNKAFKDLVKREEREEKARQLLLGALASKLAKKEKKAEKTLHKVMKSYSGTRAAHRADLLLHPEKAKKEEEAEKAKEAARKAKEKKPKE
ncbi:MAG: hypothetical protein ACYTGZ_20435 [Planctomycetota bacterium]|jgi:hypothetical protein